MIKATKFLLKITTMSFCSLMFLFHLFFLTFSIVQLKLLGDQYRYSLCVYIANTSSAALAYKIVRIWERSTSKWWNCMNFLDFFYRFLGKNLINCLAYFRVCWYQSPSACCFWWFLANFSEYLAVFSAGDLLPQHPPMIKWIFFCWISQKI